MRRRCSRRSTCSPAPGWPCIWSSRSTSTTTPRGVGSTTAPEKPMPRIWIDAAAVLLAATLLGGCATSKAKLLPHGDNIMLDLWHQETGGRAGGGQAARQLRDASSEEHTSELQS